MPLLRKPMLLRSSRLAKRRRKAIYWRIAAILFIIASFVGVASYLLQQPEVTIQAVEITGNEIVSAKDLETLVSDELQGDYLFLFPRSNIFIFPKENIELQILAVYKRIEKVAISREGFTKITIQISERHPFALWCGEGGGDLREAAGTSTDALLQTLVQLEQCYFLDGVGYIFTEAPRFTGNLYFIYRGRLVSNEPVGTQFLTEAEFGALRLFLNTIRDLDLVPVSIHKTLENELELKLEGGAKVIFSADQNLAVVLDNLESALDADTFIDRSLSGVDYIDLRFGNKVYYRFK